MVWPWEKKKRNSSTPVAERVEAKDPGELQAWLKKEKFDEVVDKVAGINGAVLVSRAKQGTAELARALCIREPVSESLIRKLELHPDQRQSATAPHDSNGDYESDNNSYGGQQEVKGQNEPQDGSGTLDSQSQHSSPHKKQVLSQRSEQEAMDDQAQTQPQQAAAEAQRREAEAGRLFAKVQTRVFRLKEPALSNLAILCGAESDLLPESGQELARMLREELVGPDGKYYLRQDSDLQALKQHCLKAQGIGPNHVICALIDQRSRVLNPDGDGIL